MTDVDREQRLRQLAREQLIVQTDEAADERAAVAVRRRQARRLGAAIGGMKRSPLAAELIVQAEYAGEPVQIPVGQRLEQIAAELRATPIVDARHGELLAERARLQQLLDDTGRRRAAAVAEFVTRYGEVSRARRGD